MKTKTSIIVLGLITANIWLFIMFMNSKTESEVIDLLSNQASAIYIGISAVLMLIVMCNIIIENCWYLAGLITLVDCIQDDAVDRLGISEKKVFNIEIVTIES